MALTCPVGFDVGTLRSEIQTFMVASPRCQPATSTSIAGLIMQAPCLDMTGEIARISKPGGRAQIADIVISETLSDYALRDIDLWTG